MVNYNQKIKEEFYQDFFDIYWNDEYENGCSDAMSCQEQDKDRVGYIEGRYGDLRVEVNPMVASRRVMIETYKDIKQFVTIASKYGDDLIVKSGHYSFPACSLMSVMSLVDLSETVKIQFAGSIEEQVLLDFDKWIVE